MKVYLAEAERLKTDCMKLYLAGDNSVLKSSISNNFTEKDLYKDAYILQSFYYASDYVEKIIIPNCKGFLLDSGAFTFFGKVKNCENVDWNDYIDKYCQFVIKNNIEHYFELDIDKIIGLDNVVKNRKLMEEKTKVKPIPVWHIWRGTNDFIECCKKYPYVAIGGLANHDKNTKKLRELQNNFPWFISTAHKYGAKIHGLGYTHLKNLEKHHFDSVDSTSWLSGNRFGAVYYFDGKTIKKIDKPNGKRVKTHQVALHNFNEWKKFSKYAEIYL